MTGKRRRTDTTGGGARTRAASARLSSGRSPGDASSRAGGTGAPRPAVGGSARSSAGASRRSSGSASGRSFAGALGRSSGGASARSSAGASGRTGSGASARAGRSGGVLRRAGKSGGAKRRGSAGKGRRDTRERRFRVLRQWAVIAGCAAAALIIIYCVIAAGYKKKFLPNTYVNGFAVGRLSVADTEDILKKSVEKYRLELGFRGGQSELLTSGDIGLTYVSSNEVEKLMENQHRMKWLASFFGKKNSYTVKTSFQYDSSVLRSYLESLPEFQEDNITSPKNSTVVLDADHTFRVSTEFQGNRPNEDVIFAAVDEAVNSSEGRLSLTSVEGAYAKPDVTSADEDLLARTEELNSWLETEVTLRYRDGTTETIGREQLASWATKDDEGLYRFDDETVYMKIYAIVQAAADKYQETHDTLTFHSTRNGDVTLWCSTPYGYRINVDSQTEKIFSLVYSHEQTEYELENAVRASAEEKVGDTYVEVDVTHQHVYYYEEGRLVLDDECVTGLESASERRTPSGVFAIFDKAENMTLGSLEAVDEEQRYESHVNYWMPFYESYGLHDAEWRDEFGGDLYEYIGSHGCVNLPPSFAKQLWDNVDMWTPVVVCRASDAVDASEGVVVENAPEDAKSGLMAAEEAE